MDKKHPEPQPNPKQPPLESEVDRYERLQNAADRQIKRIGDAYDTHSNLIKTGLMLFVGCATIIIGLGSYFFFHSITEMEDKAASKVQAQIETLTNTVNAKLAEEDRRIEAAIDERFKKENIGLLIEQKVQVKVENVTERIIGNVQAAHLMKPILPPDVRAPFVLSNNVYVPRLVVSWTLVLGLSVSNYEVYMDGTSAPIVSVTSNQWTMTAAYGLTSNSTHSFKLVYVMTDGRRSPISDATSGTTWSGLNWGGIPYEWMAANFGGYNAASPGHYTTTYWPEASTVLGQNMTLINVFVSGGDPHNSSTWFK